MSTIVEIYLPRQSFVRFPYFILLFTVHNYIMPQFVVKNKDCHNAPWTCMPWVNKKVSCLEFGTKFQKEVT